MIALEESDGTQLLDIYSNWKTNPEVELTSYCLLPFQWTKSSLTGMLPRWCPSDMLSMKQEIALV